MLWSFIAFFYQLYKQYDIVFLNKGNADMY